MPNGLGIIGKSVQIRRSPRYCEADEIVKTTGYNAGKGQE